MIDADAVILLPGAGLIIPEREEPGIVAGRAQRIGDAEIEQAAELIARAWQEKSIATPSLWIARIRRTRDHVVVASHDQRFFQAQAFAGIRGQTLHPRDLVGVLLGFRRIDAWQGNPGDAHGALGGRNSRFSGSGGISFGPD